MDVVAEIAGARVSRRVVRRGFRTSIVLVVGIQVVYVSLNGVGNEKVEWCG